MTGWRDRDWVPSGWLERFKDFAKCETVDELLGPFGPVYAYMRRQQEAPGARSTGRMTEEEHVAARIGRERSALLDQMDRAGSGSDPRGAAPADAATVAEDGTNGYRRTTESPHVDELPVYVREMVNLTPRFLRELSQMSEGKLKALTAFVNAATGKSLEELARAAAPPKDRSNSGGGG